MLPESHPLYEAELMLLVLFERAPGNQRIEFRAIWGKERKEPPPGGKAILLKFCVASDLENAFDLELSNWILKQNSLKYDVYFGVCPRYRIRTGPRGQPLAGQKEDVSHAVCAWMDYDRADWRFIAEDTVLKPTFVVATGHGAHFYYRYPDAVPIERAIADSKAIAARYGGDKATDAPRILRVPGTRNWKSEDDELRCALAGGDISAVFEGIKEEEDRNTLHGKILSLPWEIRNPIINGYQAAVEPYLAMDPKTGEIDRSTTDFRIQSALFSYGFTEEDIRAVFQDSRYGISAKTLEEAKRGNAENYLGRTIEKAKIEHQKRSLQYDDIGDVMLFETWADLAKAPALQFAVDRILPIGGLLLISGPGKSGKSILANDLLLLLAGAPGLFMETFKVNHVGPVAYCQAEISRGSLEYRLAVIAESRQVDRRKLPVVFLNRTFDLSNTRHINAMINGLRKIGAQYLIIDPMARFHSQNENRQNDMAMVLKNLDRISRDSGVFGTVLIHHHAKPVEGLEREGVHRIRGASVIGDWGNAHMLIKKRFNEITGRKFITVEFELRDAKEPLPMDLVLNEKTLRFEFYSEDEEKLPIVREALSRFPDDRDEAKREIRRILKTTIPEVDRLVARVLFDEKRARDGNGDGRPGGNVSEEAEAQPEGTIS